MASCDIRESCLPLFICFLRSSIDSRHVSRARLSVQVENENFITRQFSFIGSNSLLRRNLIISSTLNNEAYRCVYTPGAV